MPAGNPWYPQITPSFSQPNYNQQHVQGSPIWVNSEEDARNYPIARGNTLLLMDSQNNYFYLKTSDITGTNIGLQKFSYEEVKPEIIEPKKEDVNNREVTELKTELEQFRKDFMEFKTTVEDLLK